MGVNSGNREQFLPAIGAAKSGGPSARRGKGRRSDSVGQQVALRPVLAHQRPQLGVTMPQIEQSKPRPRPERRRRVRGTGTLLMLAGVIVVGAGAGTLFGKINDNSNMVPGNADDEPILPPDGPPVLTLAPLNESVQNPQVEIPVVAENPQPAPEAAEPAQAPTTAAPTTTTPTTAAPSGGEVPLAGTPIPLAAGQAGVSGIVDFCFNGIEIDYSNLANLSPPWNLIVANNEPNVFSTDINSASINASDWQRPQPPVC